MKFALKLPRINRNWLMLGGAILLGIVATGLTHKMLKDRMDSLEAQNKNSQQVVDVAVPKHDLPRGATIQKDQWAIRHIPAKFLAADAIDADHFGRYIGARLSAPIRAGDALLPVYLELAAPVFSSTLENGNRALTTEVDEVNSISGMLRPADHIDLMVTAHGSGASQNDTTFALLTNVAVLATGQVTRKGEGSDKQSRTYTTITLSVSPTDAERIVVAKSSGRLTAILRNPDDKEPNAVPAMSIDDVLPKKTQQKVASHENVQYIVGGRS